MSEAILVIGKKSWTTIASVPLSSATVSTGSTSNSIGSCALPSPNDWDMLKIELNKPLPSGANLLMWDGASSIGVVSSTMLRYILHPLGERWTIVSSGAYSLLNCSFGFNNGSGGTLTFDGYTVKISGYKF